eukprot:TCONS_00034214-protein
MIVDQRSPPIREEFYDNFATAGVPVVCVTTHESVYHHHNDDSDGEDQNILPLPASKYRYSKWHQLEDADVTSDMLRCPRIRKAPTGFKVQTVLMLEEQERAMQADDDDFFEFRRREEKRSWFRRNKKKDYSSKLEKWEACECVNLSYQDMGHGYQTKEFLRVLRRLIRAETIELIENSLTDLSSVTFPRVRQLYLQRNHLSDLKKLPTIPGIEHLSLQQNNIKTLKGLERLNETRIRSIILRENPIALMPNYRKEVFRLLPDLKFLDELPRLETDDPEDRDGVKTCCIF